MVLTAEAAQPPVATSEPVATAEPTVPPRPTPGQPWPPKPRDVKKPDEVKKPDPPVEKPAESGSGRLLAIASGGSCAFSVDGGSKGSGSSLSVSLPAGKHSVTCKPSSGSAKSRSVTIKANETSMLTFKL